MSPISRLMPLVMIIALAATSTSAQVQTGTPPFGSFGGGPDVINLANLNTHWTVPLLHKPGRGTNFDYDLTYDSSVWTLSASTWQPTSTTTVPGWQGLLPAGESYIGYSMTYSSGNCGYMGQSTYQVWYYQNFYYFDPFGVSHGFSASVDYFSSPGPPNCPPNGQVPSTTVSSLANDGSGYTLYVNPAPCCGGVPSAYVVDRNGTTINAPVVTSPPSSGSFSTTDRNGNQITFSNGTYTDTLGTQALAVIGTAPSNTNISYTTPSGSSATLVVTYQTYTVRTNFGCNGVTEYNASGTVQSSLVDRITLPNNNFYQFSYETTPGDTHSPHHVTGRIASVTLPTGGSITYIYNNGNMVSPTASNGIVCGDGSTAGFTHAVNDGTTTNTWTYARGTNPTTTTITAQQLPYDSAPNQTVLTFDSTNHETSRKIYQGSATGTPLRAVNTTWATNGTPATKVVILEDGQTQSETDTTYDSYGSETLLSEYDWGSGAHGPLLRTTSTSFMSGTPHLVTQKIVSDGSGTRKSRTDITYDSTSLTCVTGAAQHDDTNYGCSFTARGNPTSVTTYTDAATPAGAIAKISYYDSLGNLRQADLDCCQKKVWSYSATTQYAWPDSETCGATGGPQTTTSKTYDINTGLVKTATDENTKVTTYTYDNLLRQTNAARPDGSNLGHSYDDAAHTIAVNNPIDGTNQRRVTNYLDGLGRGIKRTTFDVSGTSYSIAETQLDAVGRTYRAYIPHNSTRQYFIETRYDALGRVAKTILQDGGQNLYSYTLNTVTTTDPAGNQRKSQSDSLGRVTIVFEPDVANGNTLTQQTAYTFNVYDTLMSTTQASLTRTYNYDGLNRLTSEVTPEAGTISYLYNNFSLRTQRTDARGVITTYSYDTLNRPTGIGYNVGSTGVPATSSVTYAYGTSAAQNNNGRLLTMTDGVGSETYSYDVMGRVTQVQKVIAGTTYTVSYSYNQDGKITSETYPSNRIIQTNYDLISRSSSVANGSTNYVSGETYNPAQQVTGFTYGNGVAASFGFTADRMLRQAVSYTMGGQTLFGVTYGYTQNGGNNGQITSVTDTVDSGRSATYTYDALRRLTQAVTTGSVGYSQWGLTFAYDRFGSRTNQSQVYDGPPINSVGMATNSNLIINPVPPYAYDAGGDMTNDGANTLTYDAENRLITSTGVNATNYSFDGHKLRVKKVSGSSSTVYVFDLSSGNVVAEYDNGATPALPSREYIYANNKLLATIAGGVTTYHLRDHLSVRVNTDASGNVIGQEGHYPYGESWYATGTTTKWAFASYERDSESGNDYAMDRSYVNRLGRFSTIDPVIGNPRNVQSLNRYAYVVDDPIDLTDPTGDDWISDLYDPSKPGPDYSGNPDLASLTGSRGNGGDFGSNSGDIWSEDPGIGYGYGWPGGFGGSNVIDFSYVICDCHSLFYSQQEFGCYYGCSCSDGEVIVAFKPPTLNPKCRWWPCPGYVIVTHHVHASIDWGGILWASGPGFCK